VEVIKEVPVDRGVQVKEVIKEVPVEKIVVKEVPVERIVEKIVEVPVERVVEKIIEVPKEVVREVVVEKEVFVEKPVVVEKEIIKEVVVEKEVFVERSVPPLQQLQPLQENLGIAVERKLADKSKDNSRRKKKKSSGKEEAPGAQPADSDDAIDHLIATALSTDPLSLTSGHARAAGGHKVYDKGSHKLRQDLFRGRFPAWRGGSSSSSIAPDPLWTSSPNLQVPDRPATARATTTNPFATIASASAKQQPSSATDQPPDSLPLPTDDRAATARPAQRNTSQEVQNFLDAVLPEASASAQVSER